MSGASKRLPEDGGHSTPVKRSHEEPIMYATLSGKLMHQLGNEFHLPAAKLQRVESRDVDKKPLHRMTSSPNHVMDHPTTSENRSELRASKDVRNIKSVNREIKLDTRDSSIDVKIDLQVSKGEGDARDTRGNEKELRSDRVSYNEYKGPLKYERDSYASSLSHSIWKDREHLWTKRYSEPANDGMDSWPIARHLQSTWKDQSSRGEDRNPLGSHEGVAENKIDLKGDEKLREKDKRQLDFGDWVKGRNDIWEKGRIDRRGSVQLYEITSEGKDLKDDKVSERWERERKDIQKDKEQNEQEKDLKKESPNSNERDNSHYVKEVPEGSVKISDQAISSLDLRRSKDDVWKGSDRDKKRERDAEMGDRYGQSSKCYDKELDDDTVEGDGGLERDRDASCYGIQQRRRMFRSRGANQSINREPRFRSRARDPDGSQGKADVSTVVYKAGECLQEILRTWSEFEASQDRVTAEISQTYPTVEIRIPVEYVTSTNRQVRGAQLWGTDVYTNDSDLVAVLMHTGYCCPTSTPPPSAIHELRTTIQVLPPQECYTSSLRNNVRSRSWGAGIGCSFRVERCCILKKGGGTIDLEPRRTHLSAVEPTIAPVSAERTMTTRAAASNALRQQRFVREVTIQYNLCNEPWLKYSINIVADKGLKKPLYTSARLKKGEVLYLETHYSRYELCFNGEKVVCNGTASTSNQFIESESEKQQNHPNLQNGDKHLSERENIIDVYRWSRCKKPIPQDVMHSIGIPLPLEHVEVLEENLDWEDVQWSQTGVWIDGKEYALARVHFLSPN